MPTIQQQINQLKKDKETLNTMLNTMGVETTGNETFTQLTPLVGKIVTDPILQNKTIEITENGTINITADEGFDGLNTVDVTVNVESQEITPIEPDYIKSGLVAWFDGEDKPHDSKYWISRVGVDYISDVNGKTLLSDTKSFKNNKTLAMITSADYYKQGYTIEIVGKMNSQVNSDNSSGAWFLTMNETGTWGIGVKNATGDVTFVNHTVNAEKTFTGYLGRTFSASLYLETVYSRGHTTGKNTGKGSVNGCEWFSLIEPTASGVGTILQNHAILCYYARTSGTTEKVDGEINCIRIYNRKLTNEELLHNHNIDKTRFNITE